MKELIPVRRDIIGKDLINGCEGRCLHEFLGIQTRYNDWFDRRIEEYGFIEGQDFYSFLSKSIGGRPSVDHFISIDMAKEVSMVEKTVKGKEARLYFIACEKAFSKLTKQLSELDARIKVSRLFTQIITEGRKAGLSKKAAVLRAYTITFEQTGYDCSDALPEDFRSSPICGTESEESEQQKKQRMSLDYIARRGGQVTRGTLIASRILSGGALEYDDVLTGLSDSGLIEIEKKREETRMALFLT